MTPSRRVTWQATSDDEKSWPRSAARPRGRSRRARKSRLAARMQKIGTHEGTTDTTDQSVREVLLSLKEWGRFLEEFKADTGTSTATPAERRHHCAGAK